MLSRAAVGPFGGTVLFMEAYPSRNSTTYAKRQSGSRPDLLGGQLVPAASQDATPSANWSFLGLQFDDYGVSFPRPGLKAGFTAMAAVEFLDLAVHAPSGVTVLPFVSMVALVALNKFRKRSRRLAGVSLLEERLTAADVGFNAVRDLFAAFLSDVDDRLARPALEDLSSVYTRGFHEAYADTLEAATNAYRTPSDEMITAFEGSVKRLRGAWDKAYVAAGPKSQPTRPALRALPSKSSQRFNRPSKRASAMEWEIYSWMIKEYKRDYSNYEYEKRNVC